MKTMLGRSDRTLVFVAVATEGNITKAAEHLGCSKAHVSTLLTELEADLGVQLVHRTTRSVGLTDAGVIYLRHAGKLEESLVEAEQAVSAARDDVAGDLQVTAPTSLGESVVPRLLIDFCAAYPLVKPALDLSGTLRDLTRDRFDVAFRATSARQNSVIARPLGMARKSVVASPAFLKGKSIVSPQDLSTAGCVMNGHFADEPTWLFLRGRERVSVEVSGAMRANTYEAVRQFALLGAGAARLPCFMVADDVAAGRLEVVCGDWQMPAHPLFVAYPDEKHVPRRTRAFVEFAADWFQAPARKVMFN